MSDTPSKIKRIIEEVFHTLLTKNADYGDSWKERGILSQSDTGEKLLIRIDDKLRRFTNISASGPQVESESKRDTVVDLIGYFVLYLVMMDDVKAEVVE